MISSIKVSEINKDTKMDKDTFSLLYKEYRGVLFMKLSGILDSQEVVNDIVQEVYLRIWRKRTQIKMDKFLKSYMFRMGYHLIMDHYRRQGMERRMASRAPLLFLNSNGLFDEDSVAREEEISHLEEIINQLPPKRKKVFILCKFGQKSYKEVSEILDISPSTISDHIVKAGNYIKTEYNKKVYTA